MYDLSDAAIQSQQTNKWHVAKTQHSSFLSASLEWAKLFMV